MFGKKSSETRKNKGHQTLEKVGNFTIENIPEINGQFGLPKWKELVDAIKDTTYRKQHHNDNLLGVKVVNGLFFGGGIMIASQKAIDKYGEETVMKARRYFVTAIQSFEPTHQDKTAVCSWLAENIFDCKKMIKENGWK